MEKVTHKYKKGSRSLCWSTLSESFTGKTQQIDEHLWIRPRMFVRHDWFYLGLYFSLIVLMYCPYKTAKLMVGQRRS